MTGVAQPPLTGPVVVAEGTEDVCWRAFDHDLAIHRLAVGRPCRGHPLSASSFLTHHFSKAQVAAGVSCRFHDLRHTSVALAIAAGAHPKAIQSRMGHSSINVTLDRYGHLFPELDEAIAEAFGAV